MPTDAAPAPGIAAPVAAFGLKFGEAIDYLKGKLPVGTQAWDDLAGPVHAKVFAIAGATKVDLVADMHAAMVKAIDEGQSISEFRKAFDGIVQQHGWTYKGKRGWRTRVIYDTNMRSAHMAGRWQQLVSNSEQRPYLMYRTAGDSRVRPQHRAWDGLCFHINHDFWKTHYPPNGWGCRCTVRSYSEANVADQGISIATEKPRFRTQIITDKNGEVTDLVPEGIDAGWDHNVGQSWLAPELALGEKLARLPIFMRGVMAQKAVTPAFQQAIAERFVQFQQGVKQDLIAVQAAEKAGEQAPISLYRTTGAAQMVGYLDEAVLGGLAEAVPALELQSTALVHVDFNQKHIEGSHKNKPRKVGGGIRSGSAQQVWPAAFINQLPAFLADYQAVYLDTSENALIFVPKKRFNQTVPTAIFKQGKTKEGKAWMLRSLGSKTAHNLKKEPQYRLISGSLDE